MDFNYYPFGMVMPGRSYTSGTGYRYGFNGKENDNEVKGSGNQQDYGFRIYETRLARFLSVDPLIKQYPELTPYQFASNTPLQAVDLDGLERASFQTMWQQNGIKNKNDGINVAKEGTKEFAEHVLDFSIDVALLTFPFEELIGLSFNAFKIRRVSPILSATKAESIVPQTFVRDLETLPSNGILKFDPKLETSKGLVGEYYDFDLVRPIIPDGIPNTFSPGKNNLTGEKYIFTVDDKTVELKWHSPDPQAAKKWPGCNSGSTNTAQIRVDEEYLDRYSNWVKKENNDTHIPLVAKPNIPNEIGTK